MKSFLDNIFLIVLPPAHCFWQLCFPVHFVLLSGVNPSRLLFYVKWKFVIFLQLSLAIDSKWIIVLCYKVRNLKKSENIENRSLVGLIPDPLMPWSHRILPIRLIGFPLHCLAVLYFAIAMSSKRNWN